VEFSTLPDSLNESTESLKIHVQLQGHPESAVVLEADIEDNNGPSLLSQVSYIYDPANQLIHRNADADGDGPASATNTVYSYQGGQVALQFDGPGTSNLSADNLSHRYLWNPAAVDQLLADEQLSPPPSGGRTSSDWAGNVVWPLTDHLGTICDLATHNSTSNTTSVTLHRQYDAFGNLVSAYDASAQSVDVAAAAADESFGYTGRMFDVVTGLQNNLNRWYDPKTGNWISEDPIGFGGDFSNIYRYARNSPTSRVDPSGLDDVLDAALVQGSDFYSYTVVALYYGNDPGNGIKSAKGCDLKAGADAYRFPIDVSSWKDAMAKLKEFVKSHGRIDHLVIIDHSSGKGQNLGADPYDTITADQFKELRGLLGVGALVDLTAR
jgi:RHS repeat-associated protein